MTRTLVIVRTHRADLDSLAAFDRLATSRLDGDVVFCVDERKAVADMSARPKASINAATLAALGLFAHPNCGWRCGDYAYYAARTAFPDYDFYWLMEPDVQIHTEMASDLFAAFAACNADFLAAQLGPRSEFWRWTATILPTGLPVYGCLFPITRLSGQAIDYLLEQRRALSTNTQVATVDDWPNDEAFTASLLMAGGFTCRDLNDLEPRYTDHSFGVGAVIDYDLVLKTPPDGLIYHPVRAFRPWIDRAEQQIGKLRPPASDVVQSRSEASYLTGVALACSRHPAMSGAALAPLLLARASWTTHSWSQASPIDTASADERQAEQCTRKLQGRFGVHAAHPRQAVAYIVRGGGEIAWDFPSISDFTVNCPYDVGRFPVRFALPYAFDAAAAEMLFTLHVSVHTYLAAGSLPQAQRDSAKVVARVHRATLAHLYGRLGVRQRNLLFVFGDETAGMDSLLRQCRNGGRRVIENPGPLLQLGARNWMDRDGGWAAEDRACMLEYSVAPFPVVQDGRSDPTRLVIRMPSRAGHLAAELLDVFTNARAMFIFDPTSDDENRSILRQLQPGAPAYGFESADIARSAVAALRAISLPH